jgi:general secretion pathway protein D
VKEASTPYFALLSGLVTLVGIPSFARAEDRTPAAPAVTPASVASTADKPQDKAQDKSQGKEQSDTSRLPQFEKGMEFLPKSPTDKVAFSLEDADLNELLRVIGEITGRRFVVAAAKVKSFKATVYSPQKITVAEAYQVFLAILQANDLTLLPSGNFWKVVDTHEITKQVTPVTRHGEATTTEERYVTRIHRLQHVSADDVATGVLSKFQTHDGSIVTYPAGNLLIMTDTGDNIRRMTRILEDIDVGSATDKVWLEPLFYIPSADMEKRLTDIFDLKKDAKDGKPAQAQQGMGELRLTKLVALDRPNAIVIVGSETSYRRALEFIKRIDVQVTSEGDIHVVPLQYADAKKIVPSLNEAVQGASAAGTTSAAKPGAGPLAILESSVKISAEETTNSILVTSSEHDFVAVREVIAKLDKPRRQVFIEAVVMDLSLKQTNALGVKWHGADVSSGAGGDSIFYGGMTPLASIGAPLTEGTADLQALALGVRGPSVNALGMTLPAFGAIIEASTNTEDFDILQTPHILATDNMPAEIHSQLNTSLQRNAPSLASLPSGANGANALSALSTLGLGTAPATQNYGKIGPKIKITPHLNASDEVRLDVEESISDATGEVLGTLGTVPFMERGATTTLTVRDQQTVVIGGLVRDKTSHTTVKTPILGDIPILGALFRQTSTTTEKSNLVLVLTPYIIREQDDLRRIYERKMQERQDFLDHSALFNAHKYEAPKDYTRTHGLLEDVRQQMMRVDEKRAADEAIHPAQPKVHEASEPLDLPAPRSAPPQTPSQSTNAGAGGTGPARALDKIEH